METPKKKKTFFKDYDLYSDANPKDTIRIKYDTEENTLKTIKKLEQLFKSDKYPHVRISQVANVMNQRLRVIDPKDNRFKISNQYFNFLKERTKAKDRKKLKFSYKN